MTPEEFKVALRKATHTAGSVAAWAKKAGVSRQYVSNILNEGTPPGEKVLSAMGLREVTSYEATKRRAPISPSVIDCADESNRIDARRELDRAESSGSLHSWATKWGRALIEGYEGVDGSEDIQRLENEVTQLENDHDEAIKRLNQPISDLAQYLKRYDVSDEAAAIIRSVINELEDIS